MAIMKMRGKIDNSNYVCLRTKMGKQQTRITFAVTVSLQT